MSTAIMGLQEEKDKKLREMILYICKVSEGDPNFSKTKLNKILFFSDFCAYRNTGKPITGQEYLKQPYGPCPRRMKPMLLDMEEHNEIQVREENFFGCVQKRPFAWRKPDLSLFTAEDIALVDDIIQRARPFNASEISGIFHNFLGWQIANIGETIPYPVALFETRELTPQEQEWGRELESKVSEVLEKYG